MDEPKLLGSLLRPRGSEETPPGVSMISSWVGVPPLSSLTGVPSTPSPPSRGLPSPRPRLNPGFPWRKRLILDSRLGGETERLGREGGGGGEASRFFSQSLAPLLLSGVSRLRLLVRRGLVLLGVVGVGGPLAAEESGEAWEEGAEEEELPDLSREDRPEEREEKMERNKDMGREREKGGGWR